MKGARKQVVQELTIDAAVPAHVAIIVGGAFPDADRGEVRRLQCRGIPLVHGEVGNAVHSDLAAAPWLLGGPFDAFVDVAGFPRRPRIEEAGRTPCATRIDPQADIAVRHPLLRIDQFPDLVFVGRAFRHLGKRRNHALPGTLVAVLKREALTECAIGENDRVLFVVVWPEYVGPQHDAIVHRNRHVPVNPHPVSDFGCCRFKFLGCQHRFLSSSTANGVFGIRRAAGSGTTFRGAGFFVYNVGRFVQYRPLWEKVPCETRPPNHYAKV